MKTLCRAVLAVAALAVSACAMTPDTERRDRLAVQSATMALIERADIPAEKAERIADAVDKARTLLSLAEVSVQDIRVALSARIAERAEHLSPLEKLAANELIDAIASEVEGRIGAGVLSPEQRVSVNKVLDWVEVATVFYVPK